MFKRYIKVVPPIAALLLIAACSKEADSGKYLDSAKKADSNNDVKTAVIELKNALQKNPENAEARALLGQLYVKQGEPASAEKELRRAMQMVKDTSPLMPELGQALIQQGQFQKVIDEIHVPTSAAPLLRARVLAIQGNAYTSLKQNDKAKAAFEEARKLAPELADADAGLAVLAMVEQNDSEVAAHIESALAKDPKRVSSWLMKGFWLQTKGKVEESIAAYQAALRADPKSVQAHSSLANIYLGQGKLDQARAEVAAIKKLDSAHLEGAYLSARIEFQQKNFTAARDILQEILKVAPNHAPSMTLFAATAIELGSFNQAEQYLLPVLQRYPDNVMARRLLAMAQFKLGQHERALESLKPLLATEQPDAFVLSMAGEISLQLKQYVKSTEYFERAAKARPDMAGVRTSLAISRLATGNTEQAMADLNAASALESDTGRADMVLIMTHIQNKAWDAALKAIDSLEKKQPTNPISHHLRGGVHLNKGDKARARTNFEKALAMDSSYFPAAMSLAQLDIEDKKPDAARKRFESVLAKDKNNVRAMLAIAGLEANAKNEKAYLEWLNKAANANPAAVQPRALLAQYYLQKKDPQKALSVAREAANANPNQAEAIDLLGMTQMAAGEKENAIASFTKLVTLNPDNPIGQARLGAAQEVAKNLVAARAAYQKALAIKPDFIEVQASLARVEFQSGNKTEALKLVQQIQKQQPNLPAVYLLEGDMLNADKQYDKAAEKYEQAYRLGKASDIAVRLHLAYTRAGKPREGEARLMQWLKEHPQDAAVRNFLADSYLQQKQYKLAAEQLQLMLAQAPQNVLVLNNLAWAYQQLQDKRALATAEQAHKLAPDNPLVADTLGWILLDQGQAARALPLIQTAFSKHPDNQSVHYHYAVALARNNDRARAQGELERLLGRSTQFAEEKEARALLQQLKSGKR